MWWVEAHTELRVILPPPFVTSTTSAVSFFMTTKFTTIYHSFRKAHKISALEYILCDIIHFLCTNSRNEAGGWCYQKRENMAEEIGISKQGLLDMIERMIEKGFLVKHPMTKFLKTTSKWDAVYIDEGGFTDGKETLPKEKKVDRVGKETLPERGKETLPINNTITNQHQNQPQAGGEEDFELPKPPLINSPLGLMTQIWKHHFPNYVFVPKNDNPALREISEIIFKKQPNLVDEETLKDGFSSFCKKVKSHNFYSNTSLGTIRNKIQDILMHQGNNGLKPSLKTTELDSGVPQDEYAKYAQKVNA